jgi:uroporphyrinogen decarboxylase
MENFMADLILHRKIAEAVLDKVAGYTLGLALESAGAGIDVLCFYDDVGMQRGMQISPRCWRTFMKPRWKNILERVRGRFPQAIFFLHSCGNVTEILGDIVELGFHILHPVQPECMDLASVRKRFGKNIVLCATISAQRTFPFGSSDEVRNEVKRLKRIFITDMRCILCPSNRVQPETPWENVVTFVEEAKKDRLV